jgi:hypothetical protein
MNQHQNSDRACMLRCPDQDISHQVRCKHVDKLETGARGKIFDAEVRSGSGVAFWKANAGLAS